MSKEAFDFHSAVNRNDTFSIKYNFSLAEPHSETWSHEEGERPQPRIGFGIADMDFCAAPPIREAINRVAAHGIFGYSSMNDKRYFAALTDWYRHHYNWHIREEEIVATPGVVSGLLGLIRALTQPGDAVLVQTPAYPPFIGLVQQEGRMLLRNELLDIDGAYQIDFAALEQSLSRPDCRLMLFCSPHNPSGRVWSREELVRVAELCERHQVRLVSDEIHCDIRRCNGCSHYPMRSFHTSKNVIACISPSKTFNIAGLALASLVIPDEESRAAVRRQILFDHASPFAIAAAIAAYSEGEAWYKALLKVLDENLSLAKQVIESMLPELSVRIPEGTYLIWLDLRPLIHDTARLAEILMAEENISMQAGELFGAEPGFLRINAACPAPQLEEGLQRFCRAVRRYAGRL